MGNDAAVLIIDDDEFVRRAFRRVLEEAGFRVIEAPDGKTGLDFCERFSPGVVLLDLRMPGMDGLDVLETLGRDHPDVPVLVVSGYGTISDVVEALRRGAWDFVSKPVLDSELLTRAVARGLERASLLRQNREYSESLTATNRRLSAALGELRADEQAARQLQFQLLPQDGLRIGPYVCWRRLFPSQLLSGDFVDYFALGDRFLGFYLADVAGHGAASAFITAILTTLVGKYRQLLSVRGDETILNPDRLLNCLDSDLTPHRLDQHITMLYGVLDSTSGRLVYSNAGAFPFPFLSSGSQVLELESVGRPLNLPGPARFGAGETQLAPGASLLLASDGVLELAPKQSHRERRDAMRRLLNETADLDDVVRGLGLGETSELRDDIALLLVKHVEQSHG
jgi:serine phosphatase RsbU (regulator of sigma subunit)